MNRKDMIIENMLQNAGVDPSGFIDDVSEEKDPFAAIWKMSRRNNNAGAILAGAKMIGADKIINCIELVMKIRSAEGGMPTDLVKYRDKLKRELMGLAKKKLLKDSYSDFVDAF